MIDSHRIASLNGRDILRDRNLVIYWMQASQRVSDNPALSYAIRESNALGKPLVVVFALVPDFPGANRRHYRFMLEGLREVRDDLYQQGIQFSLAIGTAPDFLAAHVNETALLVTDVAYGKTERKWRSRVSDILPCSVVQVEGNVIVPAQTASQKEEYSAATLRRKIEPMISYFVEDDPGSPYHGSYVEDLSDQWSAALDDPDGLMAKLGIDQTAEPVRWIHGGESAAISALERFIEQHLSGYADRHNDPSDPYVSNLSPYLHFGQISPSRIHREVSSTWLPDVPVFLEELVIRRELAMNYVLYNPHYDRYEGLPSWAIRSLEEHASDTRPYRYGYDELLGARTHDPYWNAAQRELRHLGTMHGYMRMYWGKKILEWSTSPKQAFDTALRLNNTFQLDGRDPNGYAGVAWCFGKHDRPWVERPIFGNIRYMNDNGLRRKFAIDRYVERIDALIRQECAVE